MIANDPPLYREALAATLRIVRPAIETSLVEPEVLDEATIRHELQLVVCSRLTDVVERQSLAWALIYPEGTSWSELSLAGERTRVLHLDLSHLLAFLDKTVDHVCRVSLDGEALARIEQPSQLT
jgi:hypothetical protein